MDKKLILKKNTNGDIVNVFNSCTEAGNDANVSKYVIYRLIKNKKCLNGFYYEYEIIKKVIDNSNKIKCPYCDLYCSTYNGLCKHIFKFKAHKDITPEQLLTDVKYNGVRPKCKCGCGGYTTIQYTGGIHFSDYIRGHWNSVKNNWGHNPKAIENSAKTRREQYKYGNRIQWNKGKTWDETYTEEQQDSLRNNLIEKLHERVENSVFSISSQVELDFIEKYIKPYTNNFKTQYYIPEIKQFCDIYIPEINTIIEVNGTYWHCDIRKYKNGPINVTQKQKIERDNIKNKFLYDNGYKLLTIWEDDIKNNQEKLTNLMRKVLSEGDNWKCELNNFVKSNSRNVNFSVKGIDLFFDTENIIEDKKNTIYIYEDEWLFKQNIVKSVILNRLGLTKNEIYANNCTVKKVTHKEADDFLNNNHLQGNISGSYYIGLYFNDNLVSIMVFDNTSQKDEYVLLRFCSILNTNIIGGVSKLFQYFIKTHQPQKIISYCDKRYCDDLSYIETGMVYSHDTQPNYYYVNNIDCKREEDYSHQKDVLKKIGLYENKNEIEIMKERGVYKVYDCGYKVYKYESKQS